MPIIKVSNLLKRFGDKLVIDGISFTAQGGQILGLLGPNGSGKTTLIKILMGFIEADHGTVTINGLDPWFNGAEVRSIIGYVPENVSLYESLTPMELFSLISQIRGIEPEKATARIKTLSEALDLDEYLNNMIGSLSRGSKQKVAIISALLHNPEILILDEPLTGLDAVSAKVFKELIKSSVDRGAIVIFTTHIMEIAEKICDRIILIHRGRLVADGDTDEVVKVAGGLEELMMEISGKAVELEEILHALST